MKSFKQFIEETEILQTFTPTDHQKIVMLKVLMAETPRLAADVTVGNSEMTEAERILKDIGILQDFEDGIQLTDSGMQVLRDLYLIDESDQPTEEANELLQQYEGGEEPESQDDMGMAPPQDDMMGGMENEPGAGMSGIPTGESFRMLKMFRV